MAPLRFLTDQQIADVLTYTRQRCRQPRKQHYLPGRDDTVRAKKAAK